VLESVANEPRILAAFLFGSVAAGTAGPLSDVDVGLLIDGAAPDGAQTIARVTDSLFRRFKRTRVDVVALANAPMPLRYRVVRDGVLVVSRDPAALQRFIVDSVLHYLDFKPLRDRVFDVQRRAILAQR
jgi:predicted nucleotidyltransferase